MRGFAAALFAASCWIAPLALARAQQQPHRPQQQQQQQQPQQPSTQPRASVADVTRAIGSTDPAEVRRGIDQLRQLGRAAPAAALGARIREGLPPELLDRAIDALVETGRREAGSILAELARHRRPAVRAKAVTAIGVMASATAERTLVAALDDGNLQVREAAANSLATMHARGALPTLLNALERQMREVAPAIGALARPGDVDRVFGVLGRGVVFDALRPAIEEMLRREDLPVAAKLGIIRKLKDIDTTESKRFLREYVGSFQANDQSPLRRAASAALADDETPARGQQGQQGQQGPQPQGQGARAPAAPAPQSPPAAAPRAPAATPRAPARDGGAHAQ